MEIYGHSALAAKARTRRPLSTAKFEDNVSVRLNSVGHWVTLRTLSGLIVPVCQRRRSVAICNGPLEKARPSQSVTDPLQILLGQDEIHVLT